MTDFASEFNKVFGNSCNISGYDWNKKRYFDSINNECYAAEAALIASLTSEAYNKYGFEVDYFIKQISTQRDKLSGDDPLENVERRFKLHVYTENVPQLSKEYQLQGPIFTEVITVQCTIMHWDESCTLDYNTNESVWDSVVPKIGDLMYFKWCDLFYEVVNVKTFAEDSSFLATPITYTFNLRVWRNSHETVDAAKANDDTMENLRSYVELGETFNTDFDTSTVAASGDILSVNEDLKKDLQDNGHGKDNVNQHVMFEKKKERTRIDPFDGW